MNTLHVAILGATACGNWVVGLFFLKFWKQTRDRFFLLFAVAFWLLAANRVALAVVGGASEQLEVIYLVRLVAFLLIIVAIVDKNRAAAPRAGGGSGSS